MKADFWHKRWADQQIGWHRQVLNPMLEKWWTEIGTDPQAPVLVPLAGKSVDLHWLQDQGHSVVGIELSEIAVNDFFAEAGFEPQQTSAGALQSFTYEKICFLQGDLFAVDAAVLNGGRLADQEHLDDQAEQGAAAPQSRWNWYDRAALVALPPEDRVRYMKHLAELLPTGSVGLLLTFEYPQHETDGPPFSVEESEVMDLCAGLFECRLLEREILLDPAHPPTAEELAAKPNRYVEKGLTRAAEAVFRLQRM